MRADRALLARLLPINTEDSPEKRVRSAAANSAALRRHFGELTTAFLLPFAPYVSPQLPPEGDGPLPASGPPLLPAFSHSAFLEALPVRFSYVEKRVPVEGGLCWIWKGSTDQSSMQGWDCIFRHVII